MIFESLPKYDLVIREATDINKNIYSKKFSSYKKALFFLLFSFIVFLLIGFIMGRRGDFKFLYFRLFPLILKELGITLNRLFPIYLQLMFFLALFIAGPTIYAPASSFITLAFYGMIFGSLSASGDFKVAVISLFFSALCGYILTIYATFITLTSMKIFTYTKKSEEAVLEGVLFKANGFKGIFNLRYIGSYLLFFLFFVFLASVVLIFKNYLLSLL